MFVGGRSVNISDYLNVQLLDKVFVEIKKGDDILFSHSGKLEKKRVSKNYYMYYIDRKNVDEILWDNVGNIVSIRIDNLAK